MPFFIIFVLIPLIEIGLFMTVGDAIGLLPTLLLAFVTAIIGGWIVKYQGFELFQNTRNSMASGKFPAYEIFEGFCLVAAGATLITPGFFTDTIGFLLLVPSVRKMAYAYLKDKTVFQNATTQRPQAANDRIIEGEFETINKE